MYKKTHYALAVLAAWLIASGVASAAPTIVDPDAFMDGADISNAFAGVTLTTVFANNATATPTGTGAVFAVADVNASTGMLAFGQSPTNSSWGNGVFEYLRVDFASIVSSVSLDFFANDTSDSNPQLLGFDSGDNQVDVDSFLGAVPIGFPLTLTVTGNISYVFAYWDEINRNENGGLDNLQYVSSVPEPGTLALLGMGLAGMGLGRRRKRV